MYHAAGGLDESRFSDMMARFFLVHHSTNVTSKLLVAGAGMHAARQIVIEEREQAGADLAVRGQPDPRTVPAEGMRHRRDNPDLADSVVESVTPGRLAG